MKGGKFSAFDKRREFHPLNHPFRRDTKNFVKGIDAEEGAPHFMTSLEISADLDALRLNKRLSSCGTW